MSSISTVAHDRIAGLTRSNVYIAATIASCILSLIMILQNPLVGSDGVTYLRSAEAFAGDGLAAALAIYNYPTYSILIAGVHLCTSLSLVNAAYLLNTFLFGLLVVAFIRLAEVCYQVPHICLVAALVILCNPELNSLRADVYRDFGAWAFMLLAAGYFIQYNQTPRFKFALAWFLTSLAAATFRPEALVMLTVCLLYFVYYPNGIKHSAQRFVRLLVLPAVLVCVVVVLSVFVSADALQHMWHVVSGKINGSFAESIHNFRALATHYQQHVLVPRTDLASVSLLAGLFAVLLITLLKATPVPYLAIYLAGLAKSPCRMQPQSRWPFIAVVLVAAAPPALFIVSQRFLQERYVMLLALLLCVPVSAFIAQWYECSANKNRLNGAAGLLVVILLIDGLISFGANKAHISQAIDWFEQNSSVDAVVTANDTRGMFQLPRRKLWDDSIAFKVNVAGDLMPCDRGDYFLQLHKKREAHDRLWNKGQQRGQLVASFENNRAAHADIYRCDPRKQAL
ncbi:MAG: hypothetical protein ACR2P1_13800 [Pseudomonadales bacterium]